jgi:chromate reductase, NAD(P)H dehydrogenase (quinone)
MMMDERRIAVLVGSLRRDSYSGRVARTLAEVAPAVLRLKTVDIGDLPLYNADNDVAEPPGPWARFRDEIGRSDGVLFVTPEYNRSVPGALKNAIDVASRPYGRNAWNGKPAAVVSVSPGAIGGFGANHHLRQSLVFLNMPTLQQPEAYIGRASELYGADGVLTNVATRQFLETLMTAFADWIQRNARPPSP